tara:strand:- start:1814 stop:2926 length:1113 start_codon:yes stop_codon:yes gene_type:complete
MKFSTSKSELQKALQKLAKAIPTRSTLPILNSVFIKIEKTEALLKSTDLEIAIESKIPVSVEEEGAVCVPLKTLLNITSELPETRITIETNEKNKTIIITDFGKYDLMGNSAEEFPEGIQHNENQKMSISLSVFKKIIDSTLFAVSKDELKPSLSGVCFNIKKNKITAVSTDGHRLVKHIEKETGTTEEIENIIIPKKFLSFVLAQTGEENIVLSFGKNTLKATQGKETTTTRLIDEVFPDYENVIPKDNNKTLNINKKDLLGAIRRVSIFSNRSTHQVALNLSLEKCEVTTEDPERSSKAKESVLATYQGDEIRIGYNAEYLKDIVSHVHGENINIKLGSSVSAALFSSSENEETEENIMLLMPIRLNN